MNWTAETLTALATGYWQSAALISAVELGIFDHLDTHQPAEVLAQRCNAQQAHLASLLDALVAISLLEKSAAGYVIHPGAKSTLSRSSATCMLDALRYNADLYQQWGQLTQVVRTGQAAVDQSEQLGHDPSRTRRFVHGMESKARAFVPAILPLISNRIRREKNQSMLDVGSGPGTLSRALAADHQQLSVTLLDLPDVLTVAREICAGVVGENRLTWHAADYRHNPLPSPFDIILYAGALHQETHKTAESLARRFFESLQPGGQLFIVDLLLDKDRTAPPFSALFQVTMMLMRPESRVFSSDEISDILREVGFVSIESCDAGSTPYRLIAARKPE